MSKKAKNIMGQVGLVVFVCAIIGAGAYNFGKKKPQEEGIEQAELVSVQHESVEQNKTLHVSPDGNDTNPGTQESPVKTVGAAVSAAEEGDTIVAEPKSAPKTSSGGG